MPSWRDEIVHQRFERRSAERLDARQPVAEFSQQLRRAGFSQMLVNGLRIVDQLIVA